MAMVSAKALSYLSAFNSLFEMPGVLVFGCCGFLSFVDGGVWVLQGVLLTVAVLVLSLCWCAGCGCVCFCVFFLLGVGPR